MQDRCCKINRNTILQGFHPLCVEKFAFARPQQWCCGIIILSSLILLRVGDNSITRYRDNWVEIKRENVMVGQEYNFNKLTSEEVNSMGLRWGSDLSCQRTSVTFYNVWRRPLLGENQQAVWLA